ncbi:MAG TPA: phosphohydrolase [Treponema sp.]|nr:phosphohydrolase [Treponema sp.]
MKMNVNFGDFKKRLTGRLNISEFHLAPLLVSLTAMCVTVAISAGNIGAGAGSVSDIGDFETGKVAERDVIADSAVSYIDREATQLRVEAQEKLVPAVFRFSAAASADIKNSWKQFSDRADALAEAGGSVEAFQLTVQAEYPSLFPGAEIMNAYFAAPERNSFGDYGLEILNNILERGIFALGDTELRNYNPDIAELLTTLDSRTEQERVFYANVITLDSAVDVINNIVSGADMPESFKALADDLLKPFLAENVFFSPTDTLQRVINTREHIEPVMKHINKDERIVRKGFIVTEDEMRELRELHLSLSRRDPRAIIGMVLLVLLIYALFIFLRGKIFLGRELRDRESYLLSVLICMYIAGSVLLKNIFPGLESFRVALAFPTSLLVMIPAVFLGPRLAMALALALPLGAYLCGAFDAPAYIVALVSALAASAAIKNAQKRMDLIKAGLIIAAANCVAVIVILLLQRVGPGEYPVMLFWAILNGIVSGMLVLGVLPPLEQALNTATTFRLMELTDLNAPILRRLFTTAPGTYSHSIMVANLAEQACQDIGANALLARVGAYYHDLGKMENPDYFVENQTAYNKHDDMSPRLSATVIRSHVKLGVEKARALNLPQEVVDIISEHHGNSIITWFYNKAAQQESQVNADDFTYPGSPPRSKESAVVMLADVSEAAVRTLTKPTAAKIERFIGELFEGKVKHGQLADSELSFRDLETIKNAFVKVLASYYHSRIEYPKLKDDENEQEPEGGDK